MARAAASPGSGSGGRFDAGVAQVELEDRALEYLEQSADLHCLLSPHDWRFLWAAGNWEPLLGWSQAQLAETQLPDLLHEAEAETLLAGLSRPEGDPHEHLARIRHADGGYRWLAWSGRVSGDGERVAAAARDVSDRIRVEEAQRRQLDEAQFAASHDALTGLANRERLGEFLAMAIARGQRTGLTPLVLFIDLDGFKRVNDQLGHPRGDEVLRTVAGRLASAFRPSDLVARVGGDEFVAILEGGDPASARARVKELISGPVEIEGRSFRLTASVGAVQVDDPAATPADMIRRADDDMYRQKGSRMGATADDTPEGSD